MLPSSLRNLRSPRASLFTPFIRTKTSNAKPPGGSGGNKAPEINFDPRKGDSVLHEKAKRAAEIHAELNALLEQQAKRRAEEANRGFGAGFLDFVKKSKSQLINIMAAFTCVLLAYQIVNIRKGARKLLDQAEENNISLEEYRKILRVLSSQEFLEKVAKAYEMERARNKMPDANGELGGLFGKFSNTSSATNGNVSSEEMKVISDVLSSELSKVIGDRALTSAEIEEKKLKQLQKEMGLVQAEKKKRESSRNHDRSDADSFPSLQKEFGMEDILKDDDSSSENSNRVVRRKGFI